jgi:hypothetical protein
MTAEAGPAPVAASVLFLRLRNIAENTQEQLDGRREQLVAALQKALVPWAAAQRVVLDAPDGFAIVGAVEPGVALAAARLAAQHGRDPALGIGLHHGPVRALRDTTGTRIVGDGLDTAAALAGFAATHPIVASEAFRDALATGEPKQADHLRAAGEMVDERLRPHALYVFDTGIARDRARRRNVLAAGGVLLLLGAGWAARAVREHLEAQARRPAIIHLDIRPSGEVFIDGRRQGASPPLVKLSVPPGAHVIEVRSGRAQPLRLELQLQPGEEMQLSHVFPSPPRRVPPKPQPGPFDRFKFW